VTVLRDYHAENIMLMPDPGTATLGLLDFQDALAGHPAYDLVSLLQDARRDVDPASRRRCWRATSGITGVSADFEAAYHVLGAQRNAKIVGIFTRLWKRDGKPRYLALCRACGAISSVTLRIPRWRRWLVRCQYSCRLRRPDGDSGQCASKLHSRSA
jgi:aminoglycoside/choline kinase family phosphotransferase